MRNDREQPLYYLDPEDLIIATFVWVDDTLKRLTAQDIRLPRQPKQKASYSELFTIALVIVLFGLDLYRGYRLITQAYHHLFPRTPHYSRFHRVLGNASPLLACLTRELANPKAKLFVVDLKPIPLAWGHRIHTHALPQAAVGRGPLGAFSGFALAAVMDKGGCFVRWAILPGNARETWAEPLVADLSRFALVLGDRGFRWVEGVKTPPYRLRGGRRVETGWKPLMGRVRNWIETRFSVLVRSFGPHRLESKRFRSLLNLIVLAHNLVRSHALLRIAGVESCGESSKRRNQRFTSRSSRDEFYTRPLLSRIPELQRKLNAYLDHYNRERPHRALGGLAPLEYLARMQEESVSRESQMC